MRTLLVALVGIALLGTGCVVVHRPHRGRAAVAAKRCPPGHVARDGACRATGHGTERRR